MKAFDYQFEVDGKKYTLRYSFMVRRAFEQTHKKSVPGMLNRLTNPDTQTADELLDVFVLLLASAHPNVTADDVAKIIDDLGGEDEAITLLTKALESQVPKAGVVDPQ